MLLVFLLDRLPCNAFDAFEATSFEMAPLRTRMCHPPVPPPKDLTQGCVGCRPSPWDYVKGGMDKVLWKIVSLLIVCIRKSYVYGTSYTAGLGKG